RQLRQGLLPRERRHRHSRLEFRAVLLPLYAHVSRPLDRSALAYPAVQKSGAAALLDHGKPVFSTSTVPNGSLEDLTYIADADDDAVIIEMEHEGFSFTTLRTSLQVPLNRERIAEKGNLQPDVVPMVRIPPNARERNQWVIKQALDTGVYGLVLPHLSTVEDAQAAVAAAISPGAGGARL